MPEPDIFSVSCLSELVDPVAQVLAAYGDGPVRIDIDPQTGQPRVTGAITEPDDFEAAEAAVRLILRAPLSVAPDRMMRGGVLQAGPFVINPPADYKLLAGMFPIKLAATRAFGTGWHPATRHCLEGLAWYVNPGVRVLDVGSGSGILAVAAALHGASHVVAIDTSADAVAATFATARLNHMEAKIELLHTALPLPRGDSFHVIAANISARVNIVIAGECYRLLNQGGVLIASGFLDEQAPSVRKALEQAGFNAFIQWSLAGWRRIEAFKW